jgi:hypothetical protein
MLRGLHPIFDFYRSVAECVHGAESFESGLLEAAMAKVFGHGDSDGAAPEVAALANGVLAHALVFDDLHRHAKLHPGVATIPAALAVAELTNASGETLLVAIAAGYETAARVGVAIDWPRIVTRGGGRPGPRARSAPPPRLCALSIWALTLSIMRSADYLREFVESEIEKWAAPIGASGCR